MHQLPFAKDVFSNCPTQIAFNVSGEDAKAISENWRWKDYLNELTPENITALPRFSFYCRTFAGKEPTVGRVRCHPPVKARRGEEMDSAKLIKRSLECWGTDRKKVQEQVMKFLSQK